MQINSDALVVIQICACRRRFAMSRFNPLNLIQVHATYLRSFSSIQICSMAFKCTQSQSEEHRSALSHTDSLRLIWTQPVSFEPIHSCSDPLDLIQIHSVPLRPLSRAQSRPDSSSLAKFSLAQSSSNSIILTQTHSISHSSAQISFNPAIL